jgi:hypothetical protein
VILAMIAVATWAFTRPHRHLHLGVVPAGLTVADARSVAEANDLMTRFSGAVGSSEQATAYADAVGPVEVVAGKATSSDVESEVRRLSELVATSSFRTGTGPVHFVDRPAGERGGRLRCAPVMVGTVASSACVWADIDTVGVVLSPRPEPDLAELTAKLRVDVER